jgi:hypothetical protein
MDTSFAALFDDALGMIIFSERTSDNDWESEF